jgi:alkanesulfonate monooxygenase SsuD/methylene tetrahydromethanopterin reductase-like flavin-dependent oxidoreductase (luciferase family)
MLPAKGAAMTSMTFEFGMFHEFQRRAGQTDAESFAEAFEQVDAAEAWGLDVLWLAELHVAPQRSVAASPLTIASAIAARTKRMKIGIAVQVLPLCHPLRLAEEVATVDHISQGRLIFGVGRSGFPRTYEAYGVPYGESRERFAEVLEILQQAWTQERFSYEGRFHSFRKVHLVPKPLQQPHPPIRIAATNADTFAGIGTLGFPIFVAVRLGTIEELGPNIAAYRAAYAAAGHPGRGEVYLRVPVYVGATAERARNEPEHSIMQFYRTLGAQLEGTATAAGARASEQRAERGQALQTVTYDEALREKVIVGTPDQVTARLKELREALGLNGILADTNCGGLIPPAQVLGSLKLLCQEVMPQFR